MMKLFNLHTVVLNRVIYRVCDLQLGPNFGVWLTTDENFYLRLGVEKMPVFSLFTEKYVWSYSCSSTIFMATVN